MSDIKRRYERYKRGQIVLVNFSPSIGSELRNNHLAIVLTKNDSPNNGVLTVVPLSSKKKPYYLKLGSLLFSKVAPFLENSIDELTYAVKHLEEPDQNIIVVKENIKSFSDVLNMYNAMNKTSYAMVQNITTDSKLRIKKPLNKYDPIKQIKVDNNILDMIDAEIIRYFTNYQN